jgi:hypothetical protein
MISIFTGAIAVPQTKGKIAVVEKIMHLDGAVRKAWVALSGYRAEFVAGDQHVKMVKVNTKVRIEQDSQLEMRGADVIVTGELQLRDNGNDDTFNGSIYYTLFVDYTHFNREVEQ